ncbi:MAG: tail fiber protein [Oceanicaulis sp.]|nr:tail fiber protein [Oceanicaulis sp.]
MKPFKILLAAASSAAAMAGLSSPAFSQSTPYIGQITSFGFNYCPQDWAPASGQQIPVSQNPALYSLFGVTYGGNGQTYFNLPNLNGRHAAGSGYGPGLTPLYQGNTFGSDSVTLTVNQMPQHNHSFHASGQGPDSTQPAGGGFATYPPTAVAYAEAGSSDVAMNPSVVQPAGGAMPMPVRQPYLALTWCVALTGIYPSRPN